MNRKWILLMIVLALVACSSTQTNTPTNSKINNKAQVCDDSYPLAAASNKIEGYVILSYDIDQQGFTRNIAVVESVPEGVFDGAGKCALSKWIYNPKIVNGTSVYQTDFKVQLDFKVKNDN